MKSHTKAFFISLILYIAAFFAASSFVLYRIIILKPVEFVSVNIESAPTKKPEARLYSVNSGANSAQMQSQLKKLASSSVSLLSIPDLPFNNIENSSKLVGKSLLPVNSGLAVSDSANMLPDLNFGSGVKGSFFGIQISCRTIIILVDASSSIVKKGVFEAVRKETLRLTEDFNADTGFNVIVFTDGALCFREQIIAATTTAKSDLKKWLYSKMKENAGNNPDTSGSTPIIALQKALELYPDTIFIITDDLPMLKGVDQEDHVNEIFRLANKYQQNGKRISINSIIYKPYSGASASRKSFSQKSQDFYRKN